MCIRQFFRVDYEQNSSRYGNCFSTMLSLFWLCCLVFMVAPACSVAQEIVRPASKTSLLLSYHSTQYSSDTEDKEFCEAIYRGLQERGVDRFDFCGVPVPEGDEDFSFPEWHRLNPHDNTEIVEEMFLWGSIRSWNAYKDRTPSYREWRDVRWSGVLPKAVIERFLVPVRDELHARLSEIELYYSQFDIDRDGKSEVIYHMTPVYRLLEGPPFDNSSGVSKPSERVLGPLIIDPPSSCRNAAFAGQSKAYLHYVRPSETPKVFEFLSNGLGGGVNDTYTEFLVWRGQAAVVQSMGAHYSRARDRAASASAFRNVCSIRADLKQSEGARN